MAWPKVDKIACHGFSEKVLPYLIMAIDRYDAIWDPDTETYSWINCRWSVETISIYITSVWLVEGIIDSQDLTAAKLKYKIETS